MNDKKITAPFREVIYQVGNKEDAKNPILKEKMIRTLKRFYEQFEEHYPRLKVIGAVIHLDEATPHLHLDVVPYAEGGKKGLKHKVSFEKAIEQMGFNPEESLVNKEKKNPLIFNGFRNHSVKLLEDLLNGEELIRDIKNNTEKHLEVKAFKEKRQAIEELKKSPAIIEAALDETLEKMNNKQDLKNEIYFLEKKKEDVKKDFEEFEEKHKKEKKRLSEELEKEKRLNAERINQWQQQTIEKEQENPSFWKKITQSIARSRFIASISLFMIQYEKGIPITNILKNLRTFKKRFDYYNKHPEKAIEDQDFFEKRHNIVIYNDNEEMEQEENTKHYDLDR